MRPTILVPLFIILLLCTVPLVVGIGLLVFPSRVANLLSDAFVVFPSVQSANSPARWWYRLFGVAIIGVSALAVHHFYGSTLMPLIPRHSRIGRIARFAPLTSQSPNLMESLALSKNFVTSSDIHCRR
jgi:hypothetical protein